MGVDMIGSPDLAEFIHHWFHEGQDYGSAPDGWEYLGSGCYRIGFLGPDGVVYKVQRYEDTSEYQTNRGEYETWKRLYFGCKMPKHSRLPKLGYYPLPRRPGLGVVAIERFYRNLGSYRYDAIEAGGVDYWDVLTEVKLATGLGDMYGQNLYVDEDNRQLVPTDLGDDGSY